MNCTAPFVVLGQGSVTENKVPLAGVGARVVVADVNIAAAREVASEYPHGLALEVYLTEPAAVEAMVAEIVRSCGTLNAAFNNAGHSSVSAMTADYPVDDWHDLFAASLHSVYYCLKYELPVMVADGGGALSTRRR